MCSSDLVAAVVIATAWYLFRTRAGFELRAVGLQPTVAEYGGVPVGRTWLRALVLAGAIAGVGGVNFVLGYKGYYEDGFAGGAGFLGIAVALVGRNHPLGVVIAALFFATLSQGGLAINAMVPKQIVEVLQGQTRFTQIADGRFKGGHITRHYGRPAEGCHAVQMEKIGRAHV